MTADERIEKLLNRFGQTISDLPKPTAQFYAYTAEHNMNAVFAARDWERHEHLPNVCDFTDYICHLSDVIDRMEVELETATNTVDCRRCEASLQDCNFNCNEHSKVADWQLSGMYHSEFKEFVEGLDESRIEALSDDKSN